MVEKSLYTFWKRLTGLMLKFASSSALATCVDYTLYQVLVYYNFAPAKANVVSAGVGMIINFVLQKRFVFKLNRDVKITLIISLASSLIGIALGTFLIHQLSQLTFFSQNQFITKALVTGTIFFYNFFMKRFAFEKKMI